MTACTLKTLTISGIRLCRQEGKHEVQRFHVTHLLCDQHYKALGPRPTCKHRLSVRCLCNVPVQRS